MIGYGDGRSSAHMEVMQRGQMPDAMKRMLRGVQRRRSMWSWGKVWESGEWGCFWCRVGFKSVRELRGCGCGSSETVEIYTWVSNKEVGMMESLH